MYVDVVKTVVGQMWGLFWFAGGYCVAYQGGSKAMIVYVWTLSHIARFVHVYYLFLSYYILCNIFSRY